MKTTRGLLRLLLVLAGLALAACTSLDRSVSPGRDPAALREIFVAVNLNDNHGLARHLVAGLRSRGLRAESGPLTLLPASAEAVLHYDDRWSWDFGEHMTYLRLGLHDPGEVRPYATATRTRFVARSTNLAEALPPLLDELLAPAGKKP